MHKISKRFAALGGVLLVLLLGWVAVLASRWPFQEAKIISAMQNFSQSDVTLGTFHMVYFPRPGYTAERVTFSRHKDSRALTVATVDRVTAVSSWLFVLTATRRLSVVKLEGVHVRIDLPALPPIHAQNKTHDNTTVGLLQADGATLDFVSNKNEDKPVHFTFPQLTLREAGRENAVQLQFVAHLPAPAADLAVQGHFGPVVPHKLNDTPIRLSWTLRNGDLSTIWPVSGNLQANGTAVGTPNRCSVTGRTFIPAFQLAKVQHPLPLTTEFGATVSAVAGSVAFHVSSAKLGSSEVQADGLTEEGAAGKNLTVDIRSEHARLENLLFLFSRRNPPSAEGPMQLSAHAVVPFRGEPFLRRLQLRGVFHVSRALFDDPHTRFELGDLSRRAHGDKHAPDLVMPEFSGVVNIRDAMAYLEPVQFSVPGAEARGTGTYNLEGGAISMAGNLSIAVSLSQAAGGIKSVLLRPVDSFFQRGSHGAVLPIRITGTYSHPQFQFNWKK